jgi:hypothetical protein
MLSSREPAERQTAALGLVAGGWEPVETFVHSGDPGLVSAACVGVSTLSERGQAICAGLLSDASPPWMRDALGMVLRQPKLVSSCSTHVLHLWAQQSSASAAVFARLLGGRDSDMVRSSLRQLLRSGDAVVRAQVALGLASSPHSSAAGVLIDAFRLEPEAMVRRAIVRALSRLHSSYAASLLADAARVDPDDRVRALAALASRRVELSIWPVGADVAWVQLRGVGGEVRAPRAVRVAFADGFAVSAVTQDDGFLLIPGVPSEGVAVTVASADAQEQSWAP